MKTPVYEKLLLIQNILSVPKNQRNAHGKYNYRSAEDILEALKPIAHDHNVVFWTNEEIVEVNEKIAIKSTAYIKDLDSDSIANACAFALIEFEAKGMHNPQRTGAAGSYAKKYALGNLLLIDDTKDPDNTNRGRKTPVKPIVKPPRKMNKNVLDRMLKAIADGKIKAVEPTLALYEDDANRKKVEAAIKSAKK